MQVGGMKDGRGVGNRDGLQHPFLAHGLEAGDAEKVGRLEEFHGVVERDEDLVGVQILENGQKYRVPDLFESDGVEGALAHRSQKQGLEVR